MPAAQRDEDYLILLTIHSAKGQEWDGVFVLNLVMEGAFWELDAPVGRVCSSEVPIPYPHHLEETALPQPAAIVAAAKATLGG